jgi:hypothetical protein
MLQCGGYEIPIYSETGEEGKYSFLCLENGYFIPTKEYDLVKRVQEGKMSINLQMKLWSEDIGLILMPVELKEYCKGMPEWVFKGTIEQAKKRIIKEVGYVPSFMKLGYFT